MSFGLIYRIDYGEFSDTKFDSSCWNTVWLNLVGGGCNVGLIEVVERGGCEMENFDGVGGGGSNVGTSEVVGEVGSERIDFRRVGGSDVVSLDICGFGGWRSLK